MAKGPSAQSVPLWMILGTVAVVGVLALCGIFSKVHGAEEFRWEHFGVDPYAPTRAEAMRTRESAFRIMGLPAPVITLLLRETEKPGERTVLNVGDRLSAMLSKGGIVHRNVVIAFEKPPVDGRMEYAAPAEKWQVTWEGKVFTVILPDICNNWSLPQEEKADLACATVEYTVAPGDEVRFAALSRKRLPASSCWQLCDGAECSALPSPCDSCDWIGSKSVIPTGFEPLHTGKYLATSAKQTLRFPREVENEYVVLCDTRRGLGESDSWIVQPSAWGSKGVVTVPYGGQEWPAWGKVDPSKWRKP